jgi:hypothetical protein
MLFLHLVALVLSLLSLWVLVAVFRWAFALLVWALRVVAWLFRL